MTRHFAECYLRPPPPFFVLALLVSLSIPMAIFLSAAAVAARSSPLSLTRLRQDDGSVLCAADPPSVTLSLASAALSGTSSSSSSCVPDPVTCCWICLQDSNCTNYSYDRSLRECRLFYYWPSHFEQSQTCSHYMSMQFDGTCADIIASSGYIQSSQAQSMIPGECCDLPFTYDGQLFYSCTWNRTNTKDIGCFVRGRRWFSCLSPSDNDAVCEVKNITIAVVNGTVNLVVAMTVNNWIIFHQKVNTSTNFNRSWSEYRNGFGDIGGNHWLGLEHVYQLARTGGYRLRVEMQAAVSLRWYSVEYETFLLDDERGGYTIHLTGCSGDACDPFDSGVNRTVQNHIPFSTSDRRNYHVPEVNDCSVLLGAGFWFNACAFVVLTSSFNHRCRSIPTVDANNATLYNLAQSRMMMKYNP